MIFSMSLSRSRLENVNEPLMEEVSFVVLLGD